VGQIHNSECIKIEHELRDALDTPGEIECSIECNQDTYTQDYIIWITSGESTQPFRITIEEYREDDWKGNIRYALSQIESR
jgi:hypothetical protein